MRRLILGLVVALSLAACGGHGTAQKQSGLTDQQVSQLEKTVNDADSAAGQADREAASDR